MLKSLGKEEAYCEWFECNHCGYGDIMEDFKYCPKCGKELGWSEEYKKKYLEYYK